MTDIVRKHVSPTFTTSKIKRRRNERFDRLERVWVNFLGFLKTIARTNRVAYYSDYRNFRKPSLYTVSTSVRLHLTRHYSDSNVRTFSSKVTFHKQLNTLRGGIFKCLVTDCYRSRNFVARTRRQQIHINSYQENSSLADCVTKNVRLLNGSKFLEPA